jgi:uncharacterized BrkB/YihY/UPF0761 family membrane protein
MANFVTHINHIQQKNKFVSFVVAVINKYSKDGAGRYAVLLTYYLFTSLFPLLLVVTTIIDRIPGSDPHIRNTVIRGITNYFPLLGNQLSTDVHSIHSSGLVLILGVLFIIYGTRGVAGSFGNGIRQIWAIDKSEVEGFPKSTLKNLYLVIVGGLGFILASTSAALASSAGHGVGFRLLSIVIDALLLFCLFTFIINVCLPRHIKLKEIGLGAACATTGLVILQIAGSYIIGHELKHLDALYSYFALALGLLFWLYLQAQVLFYAIEVSVVSSKKLWPVDL